MIHFILHLFVNTDVAQVDMYKCIFLPMKNSDKS